jgi:hypothetical protein
MTNDPDLRIDWQKPDGYRDIYGQWGLSRDEFSTTGGWSHTLDVREAPRLVTTGPSGKPIVMNEGDVQHPPAAPYSISFRSIVPARRECSNLIVPVCGSTHHIAYGSVRLEPVFMILGESAAHIAALPFDKRPPCRTSAMERSATAS